MRTFGFFTISLNIIKFLLGTPDAVKDFNLVTMILPKE